MKTWWHTCGLLAAILFAGGCLTEDFNDCEEDPTLSGCPDAGEPDAQTPDAGEPDADTGMPPTDAGPDATDPDACDEPCTGDTPICNAADQACVQCLMGAHCPAPTPACDPLTHQCVACLDNRDCTEPTVCDQDANQCVGCTEDDDCQNGVCDSDSATCVPCLEDTHCGDPAAPACDQDANQCVGCVDNDDCSGDTPVCDSETQQCVQCTQTDATACQDETPVCDTTTSQCVACQADADCEDPSASRCDLSGDEPACVPCNDNSHCQGITDNGTDLGVCDEAECVECTGSDYDACGTDDDGEPLVCDSLHRTCSHIAEASAGLCKPCISDAQCNPGQLCVMQTEGDTDIGYFCLWRKDAPQGPDGFCSDARPYIATVDDAESIDGTTANACTLRVSTCPALNHFSDKDCAPEDTPDDSICGHPELEDGHCAVFETSGDETRYRCTVPCLSADDCISGTSCDTGADPRICDFGT